jgi:ABC-type antimicrobial peptide transport system permease subunit
MFSKYQTIQFYADLITSMEDYAYIVDQFYRSRFDNIGLERPVDVKRFYESATNGSSYGIPKQRMLITFAREVSLQEKDLFLNGLRTYFTTDQTQLTDVLSLVKTTNDAIGYLVLFSIAVGTVAIALSFFLIIVSFTANVRENSWEFGVLRAIGLNKKQIVRCYMYEALALIVSSGLLGSIVGIAVAVTLTMQFVMFLELQFIFFFPYAMFFFCFFMGLIVSLGGAYLAVTGFKDKSIAQIVKGLI